MLNLETMSPVTINPNDSIQAAIDNASAGDTIELNGGVYNQCNINVTKENLTIKASGSGNVPIIDSQGINRRGFNIVSSGVLIQGLTITNTRTSGDGGGIYISSGGSGVSVSGCNFTNTTTSSVYTICYGGGVFIYGSGVSVSGCNFINNTANYGGGIYIGTVGGNGSVSGCSFINNTSGSSGGGVCIGGRGSVVFSRFVNNTDNGSMIGNGLTCTAGCNVSSNWWGNNTPQNITKGVMEDFYQVELSADQVSTRDLNNSSVNGFVPVPLGYRMCLNGSNNTGDIGRLPDFNATIKLNNNTGLFRSDIGLFRFLPFMSPGDSFDVLAKDPWNDTINNHGNYTFSALVDNQQLNINLATRISNTSLSLTAGNITYGDNASINATLTSSNGTGLINKNLTFNINGNNYTSTTTTITDGSGVATLDNISGLHAGFYSVSVSFNGDVDYNPSTNNTTFNISKRNTSLSIVKTVNSTALVVVGDLVNYTIKVMNNGTSNIGTLILVNDTLVSGLEYVGSSASAGSYNNGSGCWSILGLNGGDTATLDITCKVKSVGNLINHAFLVLDNYNTNQTNDSSVNITVNPSGDGNDTNMNGTGGGMDGVTNGFDQTFFKSLTGLPLVLLVLLSVLGVYYWRRK